MIEIGQYNTLEVIRNSDHGFFLGNRPEEVVLLPKRYTPKGLKVGDTLKVFVYPDNQGRPVATTLTPKLTLNQFGLLKVTSVGKFGAFMDWGLAKDLLVPFKEQNKKLEAGRSYVIYLYVDEKTQRLVGSSRIARHLMKEIITVKEGQQVDLIVYEITDLGANVIINNIHHGLIFEDELMEDVKVGDTLKGYIKKIRRDNKIDVSLQIAGYGKIAPNAEKLLEYIKRNKGKSKITDKSSPDLIRKELGMSKKVFKQSVGALYKARLIEIRKDGLYLVKK